VDGVRVALGNLAMMEEAGVNTDAAPSKADALRREGQTVMFLARDGTLAALLGVADPIKATTLEAIDALHADGLRIVMLTGDNRVTAEAVGRQLPPTRFAPTSAGGKTFDRQGLQRPSNRRDGWRLVSGCAGAHRSGRWHRDGDRHRHWRSARGSRSSKATCAASSGRGDSAGRR
jgi:hypothetical protein